jgi:hypothetical protein
MFSSDVVVGYAPEAVNAKNTSQGLLHLGSLGARRKSRRQRHLCEAMIAAFSVAFLAAVGQLHDGYALRTELRCGQAYHTRKAS